MNARVEQEIDEMSANENLDESVNETELETSRPRVGGLMRAFFEHAIMEQKRRFLDQDPPDVGSFLIVAEPLIVRVTAMARQEERFAWSEGSQGGQCKDLHADAEGMFEQ